MAAGRQIKVDKSTDWCTDEDGRIVGYLDIQNRFRPLPNAKVNEQGKITGLTDNDDQEIPLSGQNTNRRAGALRIFPNSATSSGVSGVRTGFAKWEAEAEFVGVRLWLGSRDGLGPSGPVQAIVAATETAARNNATNAFQPIVGGVAYNTILSNPPAATPIKGWMRATFRDAQFDTIPAACFPPVGRRLGGSNALVNGLYTNNSQVSRFLCTDVIPLPSVPRADGGTLPLLMARVHINGGRITTLSSTLVQEYSAFATTPGSRLMQLYTTSNDGVGTLSNVPADPATLGGGIYLWPEFIYKTPVRSLLIADDSRGASNYNGKGLGPWGLEAALELSTPQSPVCPAVMGGSGHTQDEFLTMLRNALEAGHSCTDLLMPCWSQNGAVAETIGADVVIGRLSQFLEVCRAKGIRVFLHTSYGLGASSGVDGQERARLACIAWAKTIADGKSVVLVDTDSVITNYSPGGPGVTKGRIIPELDTGDTIHANGAGVDLQKQVFKDAWNEAQA